MSWYVQSKIDLLARSAELLEAANKLAEQDSASSTEVAGLLLEIDELRFTSINALSNQWHEKLVKTIQESNPQNSNKAIKSNLNLATNKLLKMMPKDGVSGFTQFTALENVDNIFLTHFLGEASSRSGSSPSRSRGSSFSQLRTPSPLPWPISPPPTPPASPLKNYSSSSTSTSSSCPWLTQPHTPSAASNTSNFSSSSPWPSTWLSPPTPASLSVLVTSTAPSTISIPLPSTLNSSTSSTGPILTQALTVELPSSSPIRTPSPSPLISPPRQFPVPTSTSFTFTSTNSSPIEHSSTSLPIVPALSDLIPLTTSDSLAPQPGSDARTHIPPSKSFASSPASTPSPHSYKSLEAFDPVESTQTPNIPVGRIVSPEPRPPHSPSIAIQMGIPKSRSYPSSPFSEESNDSVSSLENRFSPDAIEKMLPAPGLEDTLDLVVPTSLLVHNSSSEAIEEEMVFIVELEPSNLKAHGMRTIFLEPTAITISKIAGFFDGRNAESISIDVNEYLFSMPFAVRDNVYRSVLKEARQAPEDLLWAYNHIADDCALLLNVLLKELPYIPMSLNDEDQLTFAQMRDALFNILSEEQEPAAQAIKINALLEKTSEKTRQNIYEEVFEKSSDRNKQPSLEWVQAHIADNGKILWNAVIRTMPSTICAVTDDAEIVEEEEDSNLFSFVLTWVHQILNDRKLSAAAINKRIKELLIGISKPVYNNICLEILQKHQIVKKDINLQWVESHLASSQQILINALIKHVPCVHAGSF